jgi:type IV pilus assembly protein PilO
MMRDIQEQIPKTIVIALPPDFSYEIAGTMRAFQPADPIKGPQYNTYSFTIGFDGKFEDVFNTIQRIERLKPLLVVKNLKLTKKSLPSDKFKFSRPIAAGKEKEIIDILPPLIGADFTLEAFVPLTEAELKAATAAAAPPKK